MFFKVALTQKPITELPADNAPCVCGSTKSTLHIYHRISKAPLLMSSTRSAAKLICNNCGKIVPLQKWSKATHQLAAEQKFKNQPSFLKRYQSVFVASITFLLIASAIVVYWFHIAH